MHGRELATQLRQQRPGLKVLFVTGYADPSSLQDASVLEKPFMPETLLRKVHEILTSDKLTTLRVG
jgi:CheY-like chemotaxis protein